MNVVHFADTADGEAAEILNASVIDGAVQFESTGFSVYVVTYTVDFHWNGFTFNLAGGDTILLSELLEILKTGYDELNSDSTDVYDTEVLTALIEHPESIEDVEFSDPELIRIQKLEILDSQELIEDDYSEELIENTHPDWLLTSLAPFQTEETLAILLKTGETLEIAVTDIVYGDGEGETVTRSSYRHVTADGVTYLLSNNGTSDGTARVTSMTDDCVVHDTIIYNGHSYVTDNIREAGASLRNNPNTMDWDVIHKIATYGFDLPDIVQEPESDPTGGDPSYKTGVNNSGHYKVWKKAEYNANTNSIDYTLKYFQAMKRDVPLDFIFVYDDSASMYSGNRTSGGITLCEAQTTRVLILAATKALFSKGLTEGYDINVYLSGASTGHTTYSSALHSYNEVEQYLATYRTGTTRHATGVGNALTLARASKNAATPRNPVVIYLSDFHQPGTLGTGGINSANALHGLAPVYALGTDTGYRFTTNNATRYIPSGPNYYRTMNDIGGGVQELESIIKEAIGYYMKDPLTVTDELSSPLSGVTATGATGAGTPVPSAGRVSWNLGDQNPLLNAGTVYTETFNVKLDDSKVYSGDLPTNKNVSVKEGNTEVNWITESPLTKAPIRFTLGRLNQDGSTRALSVTGVKFTLTQNGAGGTSKEYPTTDGAFEVPFTDFEFAPGSSYTLTQDQTTTASLITGADAVALANPMTWTLAVNSDYTVTATKAGADTDVTVSGGKFQLWNREFTNPPLTKIYVKKLWSGASSSLQQPISFTVYGLNGTQKIALPAYAHDDDNTLEERAANTQVTTLSAENQELENTPYTKAVWVPQYVTSASGNILFKDGDTYNYTIGEAALPNPVDVPDSPIEIIGAPGKWEDVQSSAEHHSGTTTGLTETTGTNQARVRLGLSVGQSFTFSKLIVDVTYASGAKEGRIELNLSRPWTIARPSSAVNGNVYIESPQLRIPSGWTTTRSIVRVSFDGGATFYPASTFVSSYTGLFTPTSIDTGVDRQESGNGQYYLHPVSSTVYEMKETTVDELLLTLTNTFTNYNILTVNSAFTDSTCDSDAITGISAVGYAISDGAGNVIATPEASVTTAAGETKSGDVMIYVPKGQTYTARQTYYKLSDGTYVNADGAWNLAPFTTAPSGTNCTANGSTGSVDDNGGTVTFANDRRKFPVSVKATWDPALTDSAVDSAVKTGGIPYEFSWGDTDTQKLKGLVKEADSEAGEAWTKKYTDVPNYTIKGEKTTCSIDSADDPHPNYETAVEREDSDAGVLFRIVNTIKKGEITISKAWKLDSTFAFMHPDSVTVQVKDADGTALSFPITTVDGTGNETTTIVSDLVLNEANGWRLRVQADVGRAYTVEEVKIGDTAASASVFHPSYVVTTFSDDGSGNVTKEENTGITAAVAISDLNLYGAVVDFTNSFDPIARVSTDNGTTWTYFEALADTTENGVTYKGAFNYANTLTGDVIIETLYETHARYTLTSGVTFDGENLTSVTLRTTQDDRWNPLTGEQGSQTRFRSTISRGTGNNASMFTVPNGKSFTTKNIILDGGAEFNPATHAYSSGEVNVHGGIVNVSGSLTVDEGTTMQNTAVKYSNNKGGKGGAVYVSNQGTLTISGTASNGVVFNHCRAHSEGAYGAIYTEQTATLNVSYADFSHCSAAKYVGAVNVEKASAVFDHVSFTGCKDETGSDGDGTGGLRSAGATLTLTNCTFDNCSSSSQGGAVFHKGSTSCTVTNCTFRDCHAGEAKVNSGGALETQAKSATINGCTFTGCTSSRSAGALNFWRSDKDITATISNCTFTDCEAQLDSTGEGEKNGGFGGAVRSYGNKTTTFENCTFSGCDGTWGGAIACFGDATITGTTTISDCTAGKGGGVYLFNSATLTVEVGTTIQNCEANVYTVSGKNYGGIGGGIYQGGGTLNMNGGSIIGCTASSNGGGVYLGGTNSTFNFTGGKIGDEDGTEEDGNGGTVTVEKGNTADNGGGIYQTGGTLTINGGSLIGNKATNDGGGVFQGGGTVNLQSGSIIENEAVRKGGGVHLGGKNSRFNFTGGKIGDIETKNDGNGNTVSVEKSNTAANGGGIFQADGKLTIDGGSLKANYAKAKANDSSSGDGGGIYLESGTIEFKAGTLSACNADKNGGGACLMGDNAVFNLFGGTIEKCDALANGGGVYQENGSFAFTDGLVDSCNAASGGGVYIAGAKKVSITKNGDAIVNCRAINATVDSSGTVTIADTPVAENKGGGLYQGGGTLTITASAIKGCSAYDGGGIYLDHKDTTLNFSGTIGGAASADGNTAVNGGGIYQQNGTLTITNGIIKYNKAEADSSGNGGNGGGIYLGGGSFTLMSGGVGGLNDDDTSNGGNTAKRGGGLFVANGASSDDAYLTKAYIKGGELAGNSVTEVAGGGGIAIGGPNVRLYFEGDIQVWGNTMPESNNQTQCDVCLSEDSNEIIRTTAVGLNDDSHIGVYVPDQQAKDEDGYPLYKDANGNPTTVITGTPLMLHQDLHGTTSLPFGTFDNSKNSNGGKNLNRFINNRTGTAYHGYEYYYGVRKPIEEDEDPNNEYGPHRIYWADYVCEITDPDGNLLFTNAKATAPALYQYLDQYGAFEALRGYQKFYTYDEQTHKSEEYTGTEYYVRMLVFDYALHWDKSVVVPANGKITLTMAPEADDNLPEDKKGQIYKNHNGCATISRGACTDSMFTTQEGSDFTLVNVTIDGGWCTVDPDTQEVTWREAITHDGGLFNAQGTLTLGENAVLQNSYIGDNQMGGAINFTGDGTLNINEVTTATDATTGLRTTGSIIRYCKAKNGAAVAVKRGNVTINFNGGKIENCESTNGGVLYVTSSTKPKETNVIAGTATVNGTLTTVDNAGDNVCIVSNCKATYGGAAYVNSSTGTLNLNGKIYGFSATNGGAVYLNGKDATLNLLGVLKSDGAVASASIEQCTATANGGGVYVNRGTLNMVPTAEYPNITPGIRNCTAEAGGAICETGSKARVNISVGEISGNTATGSGGGALRMEGSSQAVAVISGTAEIKNNKAERAGDTWGGAVNMKLGTLTISGGTISGNTVRSTANKKYAYGGAVSVGQDCTLNLTGGTIIGNTAMSKNDAVYSCGAGIYLAYTPEGKDKEGNVIPAKRATLNISGAPYFGGTGTDEDGNLITTRTVNGESVPAGNFVTLSGYNAKQNGQKNYPATNAVRQDIYLAETSENPASIKLTGDLADGTGRYIGDGTIWVWAEHENHHKQLTPFAKPEGVDFVKVENGQSVPEGKIDAAHLKAFRNAQDDGATDNSFAESETLWLYGTIEGDDGFIYWNGVAGSRKVVLRKVNSYFAPVKDMTFVVYKGKSLIPYINKDGTTITQLGGEQRSTVVPVEPMKSLDSGVFWVGNLPYGWYIIEETSVAPIAYFYLVVTANGVFEGPEAPGGTNDRSQTEKAAADLYTENK